MNKCAFSFKISTYKNTSLFIMIVQKNHFFLKKIKNQFIRRILSIKISRRDSGCSNTLYFYVILHFICNDE